VSAAAPASLRLRLEMPPEVRAGEVVPIVLRLENSGDRPLELYLRGRTIAFDVVVARPDGHVVWRRLQGEIIPAVVRVELLGPGEALELRGEWDQRTSGGEPVAPGAYVAHGVVLTDAPRPFTTDGVSLRILPS